MAASTATVALLEKATVADLEKATVVDLKKAVANYNALHPENKDTKGYSNMKKVDLVTFIGESQVLSAEVAKYLIEHPSSSVRKPAKSASTTASQDASQECVSARSDLAPQPRAAVPQLSKDDMKRLADVMVAAVMKELSEFSWAA